MSKTARLTIVLIAVIVCLGILVAVKLAQADSLPNSRAKAQVPISSRVNEVPPSPESAPGVSTAVSPGWFLVGGDPVVRVYADQQPPDGRHTLPSQFTAASLAELEARLDELASERTDVVDFDPAIGSDDALPPLDPITFDYDPETDTVQVTGSLTSDELSLLSDVVEQLTFSFTTESR